MTRIRVVRIDGVTLVTPGNKALLKAVRKAGKAEIVKAHRSLRARYNAKATQREEIVPMMVEDSVASLMFNIPLYRAKA